MILRFSVEFKYPYWTFVKNNLEVIRTGKVTFVYVSPAVTLDL